MNKINIGLWKQTSKNGQVGYYVGYFLGLRIALFDNKENKQKNDKAPDLRLIVSVNQNNFNQKIKDVEDALDFEPTGADELEDNPFPNIKAESEA